MLFDEQSKLMDGFNGRMLVKPRTFETVIIVDRLFFGALDRRRDEYAGYL